MAGNLPTILNLLSSFVFLDKWDMCVCLTNLGQEIELGLLLLLISYYHSKSNWLPLSEIKIEFGTLCKALETEALLSTEPNNICNTS
jgi:hypothetical protein